MKWTVFFFFQKHLKQHLLNNLAFLLQGNSISNGSLLDIYKNVLEPVAPKEENEEDKIIYFSQQTYHKRGQIR